MGGGSRKYSVFFVFTYSIIYCTVLYHAHKNCNGEHPFPCNISELDATKIAVSQLKRGLHVS